MNNFPKLKTPKDVKSFLGLTSFYWRHIKDYAIIVLPLTKLSRKSATFRWTPECEVAFQNLKEKLCNSRILLFPQWDHQFSMFTDASNESFGFLLGQTCDSKELIISCAGGILDKHELLFPTHQKKILSLVCAAKCWHHYLVGRKFRCVTYSTYLKWLMQQKNPRGLLADG